MIEPTPEVYVRNTRREDYEEIERLSHVVYPHDEPWTAKYLDIHLDLFPEGQFVAIERESAQVVGMAASLIVSWDDYSHQDSYNDFTASGYFTNHDPNGRTLYGAEVMVDPTKRRRGIGSMIYEARRDLAYRRRLLRIRAGARLTGYHRYVEEIPPDIYVISVILNNIYDPTLSFQLRQGFDVLAVVPDYLHVDPKSHGYAALIEWMNMEIAQPEDYAGRDPRFRRPEDGEFS